MQIAVVDNDESLLRSLKIILRRQGHDVRCFVDPSEALRAVEETLVPDVILVDLVMPEMTGLQFMTAASPWLPRQCRKAIVTGHAERLGENDLASLGIEALFPKPLDLSSITSFLNAPPVSPCAGDDVAAADLRTCHGVQNA